MPCWPTCTIHATPEISSAPYNTLSLPHLPPPLIIIPYLHSHGLTLFTQKYRAFNTSKLWLTSFPFSLSVNPYISPRRAISHPPRVFLPFSNKSHGQVFCSHILQSSMCLDTRNPYTITSATYRHAIVDYRRLSSVYIMLSSFDMCLLE